MKALILIAMMFGSAQAMAGFTHYGKILFQSASTYVPANKVCRDGGYLFHKNKDSIAIQYCNDDGHNCKTVVKRLKQPVNSTRQRCKRFKGGDGDCKVWETVSLRQGTVKVKVYHSRRDWEENPNRPKRTFSYTVDSCSEL